MAFLQALSHYLWQHIKQQMRNLLIIALAGLLLTSCTPQKRLSRLLKKHPELVKTDTVWTEVTIPPDTVYLETMVYLGADTARVNLLVDSILATFKDNSWLTLPEEGRSTPREAITSLITRNAPTLVVWPSDTITVEDEGVKAQISFSKDGKARFRVIDKGETLKVPVEVNTVKVPFKIPWLLIGICIAIGIFLIGRYGPQPKRRGE